MLLHPATSIGKIMHLGDLLIHPIPSPSPEIKQLDLNSSNPSGAAHGNTESQFAPATPDKLQHGCTLSQQQDHYIDLPANKLEEVTNTHESCVENALPEPTFEENQNQHHGATFIDLNKTPRQKKPKRKKHRPKLVKEGQQLNFPKSPVKQNKNTKETKKAKRKYVRKTVDTPVTPSTDGVDQHATATEVKSCKRSLNFDLEGQVDDSIDKKKKKDGCAAAAVESYELELSTMTDQMFGDHIPFSQHPTRKELLRANLKALAMMGDSGKKDQQWQSYVSARLKNDENNTSVFSSGNYKEKVSSTNSRGTPDVEQMFEPLIHDIVERLKRLSITNDMAPRNSQNALVPFKGDNRMVPFKGDSRIVLFKGKKPRLPPIKVALDSETIRVWNLLTGVDTGEGTEGTDADKERWWEEERKIFRERVDSFIARMHLIQGDRRFSPWDGSVVDSVVGVFLTQNVSDHLSSSAFMSLMARYPPKSRSNIETNHKKTNMKVEVLNKAVGNTENTKWCNTMSPKQADIYKHPNSCESILLDTKRTCIPEQNQSSEPKIPDSPAQRSNTRMQQAHLDSQDFPGELLEVVESDSTESSYILKQKANFANAKKEVVNWDDLRKEVYKKHGKREKNHSSKDSVDWEAVLRAKQSEIAHAIEGRGQNNILAWKIQEFLKRLVRDHESIDLEWLRDVPPDKAKEFLLSIHGLGPKSVDCIRLLTLHHHGFPVDTNIQRIAVRLGWAPLQPLPEGIQLHDLQGYPEMENIQKYLWPRLCTLDQDRLYELHYQMITFGKVFCGKAKPNCNACPMRAECKHYASAFASTASSTVPTLTNKAPSVGFSLLPIPLPESNLLSETRTGRKVSEPIIEEPASPELEFDEILEHDIEDAWWKQDIEDNCYVEPEDPDEIPLIILNKNDYEVNSQNFMQANMDLQDCDMSMVLSAEAASAPRPKLKNVRRLRTEHQVYELPDSHPLLDKMDRRIPGDVCPYLLAILPTTGETAETNNPPQTCCDSQKPSNLCNDKESSLCCSMPKANPRTVKGILMIPSRTAMRGFFPLNGTYFQVNEVFVDHASCLHPIDVPTDLIWNLPRRTVYCATSIPSIFKDMTTEQVQNCFCKGFVCVRSFDQITRLPQSLKSPMHDSKSKSPAKTKGKAVGTPTMTRRSPSATTRKEGYIV